MKTKDGTLLRKKRSPKSASASKATEDETVAVTGSVARRMSEIRASNMSLVLTFGLSSSETQVLVPLIDWQLFGMLEGNGFGPDLPTVGEEVFSSVLTLENVAFLAQDFGDDLRTAVKLLSQQSIGSVKPSVDRLSYAASLLREAGTHFSEAADLLEKYARNSVNDSK